VRPLTSGTYWRLVDQAGDPATLLGKEADALVDELGVARDAAEQIARLLDAGAALAVELDRLDQQGLRLHPVR
jgi:hypothetical protein